MTTPPPPPSFGDEIRASLFEAWQQRIKQLMVTKASSSVAFVMGKDFPATELDWIRNKLIPHLRTHSIDGYVRITGTNAGCDCWSSTCQHCDGREFVVSLK